MRVLLCKKGLPYFFDTRLVTQNRSQFKLSTYQDISVVHFITLILRTSGTISRLSISVKPASHRLNNSHFGIQSNRTNTYNITSDHFLYRTHIVIFPVYAMYKYFMMRQAGSCTDI